MEKNIDMDELAAASGYRRPYLYQAEGGKTIVDPYVLAQYVKATGVDFNFLFRNTMNSRKMDESTLQVLNSNDSFERMKDAFSKLNADYQEILIRLAAYMLALQKADGTNL